MPLRWMSQIRISHCKIHMGGCPLGKLRRFSAPDTAETSRLLHHTGTPAVVATHRQPPSILCPHRQPHGATDLCDATGSRPPPANHSPRYDYK